MLTDADAYTSARVPAMHSRRAGTRFTAALLHYLGACADVKAHAPRQALINRSFEHTLLRSCYTEPSTVILKERLIS
jgi:hypothetical protein